MKKHKRQVTVFNQKITPKQQEELLSSLALVTKLVKAMSTGFTCPTCDKFDDGYCNHFNDRIPEEHIKKGCDNWSDPIPF